jgi:hypothetical protein
MCGFVSAERARHNAAEHHDRGPAWAQIHGERLAKIEVAKVTRSVKDFQRRALKRKIDPHAQMVRLLKLAHWANHELANASA